MFLPVYGFTGLMQVLAFAIGSLCEQCRYRSPVLVAGRLLRGGLYCRGLCAAIQDAGKICPKAHKTSHLEQERGGYDLQILG